MQWSSLHWEANRWFASFCPGIVSLNRGCPGTVGVIMMDVLECLAEFTKSHPTEHLIRNLTLKIASSRSGLLLPLAINGKTWGVLLLVSSAEGVFTHEHVKSLRNLTPLIADALVGMQSATSAAGHGAEPSQAEVLSA